MFKPNLFLIGFPKSGTTSIARYMDFHPDVTLCDPKEPHFFLDDMPGFRIYKNEKKYLRNL